MASRLKRSNCPKWFFSQKTTNKIFMYLISPFHSEKNLTVDPELWGCAIFGPKMGNLSWTNFFGTNHWYYFHLPIGPFHCAKFEKFLTADPELRECAILGPKWSISPSENFFLLRKPVNEPCFFHTCLSTCQKSKSDINLLISFCMLTIRTSILHKFQTKLMWLFFKKVQKPCLWVILTIFWSFLPDGEFFQKMQLCHT